MLPAQVTHVAAGAGIDEGTRPEHVQFGAKNLSGVNVRQDKRGEFPKRHGFTALANGLIDATSPTAGYKLLADRNTAVRICDDTAQVYDAKSATWKSLGRVPEAALSMVGLPSMGTVSTIEDQESCNGYVVVTYKVTGASTYAFATLVNGTTWATVRAPEQVGAASSALTAPLVASYSTYFILFLPRQSGNTIDAYYLNTATAATITTGWVSMGTIKSDNGSLSTEFAVQSLSNRVAFAYRNNTGGTDLLTVATVTIAGIVETRAVNTSSLTPSSIDIAGSIADTLWVCWADGTNVRLIGLDADALAVDLATVVDLFASAAQGVAGIATSSVAGKGRLVINNTSSLLACSFQISTGAAAADGSAVTVPNAQACGRPFQYGTRYYVPAFGGANTNDQKTCILADFSDTVTSLRPVANAAPGLAVQSVYYKGRSFTGAVTTRRYFGLGVTRSGVVNASFLAEYDFASGQRWAPVTFGDSTFLSGGLLSYLDGVRVAEAGFLIRPTTPTTAVGGAGITCVTGWRYVCVYEEVDSDGNWHVSGLSSPSASTGAVTNDTVTVTTSPLSISARLATASAQSSTVRVAFYRTLDGAVAPYYRVGTTINDTAAATVTFADAVSDTTLATRAKLYSQPGVTGTAQDKRPPPGLNLIASYNGMLVGAAGSDVWFSGQNVSGEGAWFNPIFQVPVPGEGDITALWVQDGTLFVSKRREIYAISGEAPSDNAAIGGLGLPRRLAVDLGCTESRSVCTTALGTFFQSERGIEMLTRAQAVEWIGEAMQVTLAAYPIVTSATVEPVSSTVLIELAASEASGLVSGNGRTLVYDLTLKDWVSTDRRKSAAGVADTPSQSACMIYTGTAWRYAWLGTNGRVCHESAGYLDADDSFVTSQYETAWLKHGLQQEQRVWSGTILFERLSAAGLKIETAYDYAAYDAANDKTWTEAETLSGLRQLPFAPKSRGMAMKFRVSDVAPAVLGTGQGFSFIGMSFDLAPKQGRTKGVLRTDPALRK